LACWPIAAEGPGEPFNPWLSIFGFASAFFALTAALQSQLTRPGVEIFQIPPTEQVSFVPKNMGPIWGFAGFLLGAVLSGSAVGALGHSTSISPSPSFDKPQAQAPVEMADAMLVLPQRIIVSEVKNDEIEAAITTFAPAAQRKIRKDVERGKYRLLWLTAWDWDTAEETGNTISILSDGYRKYVTLNNRRTRIAIPEPRSGYIEMRGEGTEDGNIAISLLSGTQPIALPRMSPEQTIRIQIDN
jgi:hypothetical protein